MSRVMKLFNSLETEPKSVLFTEEKIDDKVLKKLKKSFCKKDKEFVDLFNSNVDFLNDEKKTIPTKTTFVEKKDDVDRSTLYSTVLLVHFRCCILTWEFLSKSAADPKYCLLFQVYPMISKKSVANKMEIFYKEVDLKRKG